MGVLCCAGEQRRILILQIYKHVSSSLQVLKRVPQCLLVGQRSFPLEHDLITLHSRLGPKDADEIIVRSPVVSNMSFSVSMSYSGSSASAFSLSASGLGPKKTLSLLTNVALDPAFIFIWAGMTACDVTALDLFFCNGMDTLLGICTVQKFCGCQAPTLTQALYMYSNYSR